ncbi:inorganic pyrophosphatase Ppa [Thermodesulfobacteriota bacterium]
MKYPGSGRRMNFQEKTTMTITKLLQKAEPLDIETFERPENLRKTHVPFSGAPRKHPKDEDKVILIIDPYSGASSYYEFMVKDISFVEEIANIVNLDGATVILYRVWVKKQSVGLHCSPFIVEETRR